MAGKTKNILQEAIADAKALREASSRNAQNVLMEHFKDEFDAIVEAQLNEHASDIQVGVDADAYQEEKMYEGAQVNEAEGCGDDDEDEGDEEMAEGVTYEMDEFEDLEDDTAEDEEFGGEDEEVEEEAFEYGLSEAELEEALAEALGDESLQEVTHAKLGDPQYVAPDKHPTGLMDEKSGEKGWEEQDVPAKKDWTVKESVYRRKIAALVKENALLKKAKKIQEKALNEVKLFNAQLFYANKLFGQYKMTNENKKKAIARLEKAKSLSEAKMVYESISMAYSQIVENEKPRKGTRLTEALGFDKKQSLSQRITEVQKPKEQGNPFARMQVLAGLREE